MAKTRSVYPRSGEL